MSNENELSTEEAQKLFNQVGKAIQESDSVKLSEIMDKQPLTEEEPKTEDQPADGTTDEVVNEPVDAAKEDETDPPEQKADDNVEKKDENPVEEKTELDKLKEQLAAVSKENHALRSQAGRVPHVQRKIKELDKKLEELTKQHASPSSQPSTKIKPKVDELLKGIRGTDAELADAIAAAIAEAVDATAQDIRTTEIDTVKLLRANEVSTHQDVEAQRLLEMYPNAPDVFKSSSWSDWKSNLQSEGRDRILGLAVSDNADDVALAFELYAKDMVAKHPELAKVSEKKEESTSVSNPAAAKKAEEVEAERKRKKESSVNLSNPTAPGKVGLPDDPNALFSKYSEEIRKQRTG